MQIIFADGRVIEREDNRPAQPTAKVEAEKKPKTAKRGRPPKGKATTEAETAKASECSLPTTDSE